MSLRDIEQLTYAEIAEQLQINQSNVHRTYSFVSTYGMEEYIDKQLNRKNYKTDAIITKNILHQYGDKDSANLTLA